MTEQTAPTTVKKTLLEQCLSILQQERELTLKLDEIRIKKAFYKKELSELESLSHTTRDGTMLLISDMTDEHLINTVKSCSKYKGWLDHVPDKYLNELKSRNLVDKILDDMKEYAKKQEESESVYDIYDIPF